MKIGVLGSGTVAQTLAPAWAKAGHDILVGARDLHKQDVKQLSQKYSHLRIGTLAEAAAFGEVVLLAINPWTEIQHVLAPLKDTLKGKVIIDVSNNITFSERTALAFTDKSMGEYVQAIVPEAAVVKTLNITPAAMMVDPHQSDINPAIGWVAGNSTDAKEKVSLLVQDLGWDEVVDLGNLHASLLQENIGLILSLIVRSMQR
ncbi:MAG TPA: NAD(P)-binding domain-containing protein [Magnetospirillaceae bacterium]|nr:NAD(P)-binding domain-containing protein [Magnetospirillaceae bacterium]